MSGPPPEDKTSKAYKAGWMDGYGDRPKFDSSVDENDPDYIRGRAKGMTDKGRTEMRLRTAGLR